MTKEKIDYKEMSTGYEFQPAELHLSEESIAAYMDAVEGNKSTYEQSGAVPPMAISALAMTAMADGLSLPDGAVHVTQELQFLGKASIGETLISYAKVVRRVERGKINMMTVGIRVVNNEQTTVLTGEIGFVLPFS